MQLGSLKSSLGSPWVRIAVLDLVIRSFVNIMWLWNHLCPCLLDLLGSLLPGHLLPGLPQPGLLQGLSVLRTVQLNTRFAVSSGPVTDHGLVEVLMAAITEVVSLVLVDSSFMQLVPGTVKLVTKLILWTHLQPLTWHWMHLVHQALLSGPNTWLLIYWQITISVHPYWPYL